MITCLYKLKLIIQENVNKCFYFGCRHDVMIPLFMFAIMGGCSTNDLKGISEVEM